MKLRPVEAVFFYAERQTSPKDMTKLTVTFRSFAKAPKTITLFG
jgi:hypothetical protein